MVSLCDRHWDGADFKIPEGIIVQGLETAIKSACSLGNFGFQAVCKV